MRDNIRGLISAAQDRNRRKKKASMRGLHGGESRGGQMKLSFGKKEVV